MGIIAAGQITVVDLSDAPVLNAFITASRPTTQTYSKDSRNYNPSYASTPQVLTLNVTKSGSTTSIIDSISGLHWFVVDGSVKTEITSKVNTSNEYISGNNNENLTTKLNIDTNKGYRRYEATGVWRDPSTDLDVQFSANIDLLLTQNGATGPQGPQGDDGPQGPQGDKGETGNGIANTVVTYGLSMTDTTEPATWSSDRPALVKGMYLWTRTVIIYTNGESTTSYQISYIPKDGDATGEIDKTKQELLEKLETVRDDSLAAVEEAKQQLVTVRDESLAAAEEAKQQVTTVADDLSKAKTDFQNAVNTVDTKATNVQNDLSKAKQDLASQAQQLREQGNAQSELTNRVSSVEETANGTKTTVSELSKTVDQNGKNITSVTARTKVVEDDLAGTKTTLSQVKMTADSTSQKTATLETGLDGLNAKFSNLKIGAVNLLHNSKGPFQPKNSRLDNYTVYQNSWIDMEKGKVYTLSAKGSAPFTSNHSSDQEKNEVCLWLVKHSENINVDRIISSSTTGTDGTTFTWNDPTGKYYLRVNTYKADNSNYAEKVQIEEGNLRSTYSQNEADVEQKVAEYKQNADQNYASLQTTVQKLDGTVQHNKTVAEQTAEGFKTRIESLETYKDGETTRANQYFESAKTETARQLTVERTAIAKDYVAKSTYTSDVTGIRNELSATTTTANTIKTNLANYQATNNRAVANLQSNIQTANGDISSLKTKVEAVPGQITSAVSAVESKIPTEIGTVNLLKNSKTFSGSNITGTGSISSETYQGCSVRYYAGANFCDIAQFSNCVVPKIGSTYVASFWAKGSGKVRTYFYGNTNYLGVETGTTNQNATTTANDGAVDFSLTANWQRYWVVYKLRPSFPTSDTTVAKHLLFRHLQSGASTDNVHIAGVKLEEGNVASGYEPSPEDTAEQISSLSSQIKQTADGITLLATKTELNAAKSELQSGIKTATDKANSNAQTISTHTTQISALNTGLNAKVSQSDFNTLSGRVTTAENNIIAKANELSSKITSVEGKIPTSFGGRNLWIQSKATGDFVEETLPDNHITGQKKCYRISNNNQISFNIEPDFSSRLYRKVTFSAWVKYENVAQGPNSWNVFNCFKHTLYRKNSSTGATTSADYLTLSGFSGSSDWKFITYTYDYAANKSYDQLKTSIRFNIESARSGTAWVTGVKVELGSIPSDYSLAPEDYDNTITRVSTEIKQTADGLKQLSTQVTSQGSTITSHTNSINSLTTGLSAKVSQSDFNTLSGRVTTAENNITAKANELSSKISSVEGKLPSGEINLVAYGRPADGYSPYRGAEYTTHGFYYNGSFKMYIIRNTGTSEKFFWMNRFKVERNTEYTLYFKGFNNGSITNMDVWFLKRVNGSKNDWDSAQQLVAGRKFSVSRAEDVSVTFNTGNYDEGYLRFDNNGTTTAGRSADLYFGDVSVKKGKSNNGWSPSLAELASSQALKSAQSEFKQTTDSIKASVQSLDNNTVKNSSLTINADGIVMKAGKSTTDVANAIGSYFAVNQNAINLFSDKIKVKGNMIVDGSINVSKISGLDANFIKSKIEYAMIDWLKGKSITAYNGNMTIDLQNGRISFKDGTNAIYRQTSDGIHTGFLHFEAGSLGGIYAAFGATSTRQGINSKSSEFAGIRCYRVSANGDSHDAKIDKIEVIGDTVQFGHGYRSDGSIGGGFIMDTAAFANETPYSFNRVVKSIESLWRILYDHARNTGYRFNDSAFINALSNEYKAWHDMRNQ